MKMAKNDYSDRVIRLIANFFEPPCQYDYGDLDAYDFINAIDENGISWCEENCEKVTCYECWRRFFDLIIRCENEQLEYGKEQDDRSV